MTTPPDRSHGGPILIGLRELYEQLRLIDRTVSQLGAKVDTSMQLASVSAQSIAQQLADIRHDINDHEARLRAKELERTISPRAVWTAIGIITGIAGIIVTIIIAALG